MKKLFLLSAIVAAGFSLTACIPPPADGGGFRGGDRVTVINGDGPRGDRHPRDMQGPRGDRAPRGMQGPQGNHNPQAMPNRQGGKGNPPGKPNGKHPQNGSPENRR
ncbi:hypothetical protein RYD26_07840 [Pasteurellaceae bacterium LIM206]|nr:hypothetical protein [Pasteurellaceae bacterium LIM206]